MILILERSKRNIKSKYYARQEGNALKTDNTIPSKVIREKND